MTSYKLVMADNPETYAHKFFLFDLETTGLSRQNDQICQIAVQPFDQETKPFNIHILPDINFHPQASKVNGYRILCSSSHQRLLTKRGQPVEATTLTKGIGKFYEYLRRQSRTGSEVVLIGYNCKSFDVPILLRDIERPDDMHDIKFADAFLQMKKIIEKLSITSEDILEHSFQIEAKSVQGYHSMATMATMPKRNKKSVKSNCDLCCNVIKECEDSLVCEGECQKQLHRYCAGITRSYYQNLNHSSSPFVCLTCVQSLHSTIVSSLQHEIQSLKAELVEIKAILQLEKDTTEPIKAAMLSLRNDLQELQTCVKVQASTYAEIAANSSGHQSKSNDEVWHKVGNKRKKRGNQAGRYEIGNRGSGPNESQPSAHQAVNKQRPRVPVEGARKVWGTLRSATCHTVANAIQTVMNIPTSDLKIKRKFKTSPKDKKIKIWWFVVRGDETTLDKLDKSWQQLKLQTNWTLEPVLRYIDDAGSEGSADTIATTNRPWWIMLESLPIFLFFYSSIICLFFFSFHLFFFSMYTYFS